MRIKRIEIEGDAGSVAIERQPGGKVIRIDSILRNPKGQKAWETWEIPADAGVDERMAVATEIQLRNDGQLNEDAICEYFETIQRFIR